MLDKQKHKSFCDGIKYYRDKSQRPCACHGSDHESEESESEQTAFDRSFDSYCTDVKPIV